MLLYLVIFGIAVVCYGSYNSWSNKRDARERQLSDIKRRLAEKERLKKSGEVENPKVVKARRRRR